MIEQSIVHLPQAGKGFQPASIILRISTAGSPSNTAEPATSTSDFPWFPQIGKPVPASYRLGLCPSVKILGPTP
jgi:hypothetical protein